jgi:Protein required for attachment to host cells
MAQPPLIIVADRGTLKSFKLVRTPNHGPGLELIEEFRIDAVRGKFEDRYSDHAGAFPDAKTAGQGNSVAERQNLFSELETRALRDLSRQICELVKTHQPIRWSLAAPAEINAALVNGLPPELHRSLRYNLKKDLTKVPTKELLQHFV